MRCSILGMCVREPVPLTNIPLRVSAFGGENPHDLMHSKNPKRPAWEGEILRIAPDDLVIVDR